MSDEPKNKLVTAPFTPSKTVEGLGADWAGGSVHMHAGTCGGEDCVQVLMGHKRTGNNTKMGLTVAGLECFIKVGAEMLDRIKADQAKRN